MSGFGVVVAGVVAFTVIILALVSIILAAKATLVPSGNVTIEVNGDASKTLSVPVGGKLLGALASQQIFLSSSCGGGGVCGQCKVRVLSGGGEVLPTEVGQMTPKEIKNHVRLACQAPVKQDMKIEIPPEIFSVKTWICTVRSNENVATFIKELVLELPEGEEVDFKAGGYIEIERPVDRSIAYKDFDIDPQYRADWDKFNLWRYVSKYRGLVNRAYSMANYPLEKGIIKLNVRIASPPPRHPDVEPGIGSSFIFSLKPGDKVRVRGPYGQFFIRDTPCEKIYIGGGAGMAPLRSHIFELLKHLDRKEKISYWYGARSLREAFYVDEFKQLEKEHPNFSFHLALDNPLPEDNWTGLKGFIHQALFDNYLKDHDAPEDCEYFMCGPPMMVQAVLTMLDNLGVERESIFFDDFGS
ncbi:MAG: NADH:ubiquinone reductase (Na(+)-transporting) subunit F [Thermoguttaceae bacterium]|jgi:Na+-transporting NADH:ubiquinone oxidoreductase subunit F